jgi:hypothetical protein
MRPSIAAVLDRLPYVRSLRAQVDKQGAFPAGHYYSPIPERQDALAWVESEDGPPPQIPGIELNHEGQLRLLQEYRQFYDELPFPQEPREGFRYHYRNEWFSYGDAIFLYSFLRKHRPQRIIEVGSGFSSAVMLDTVDRFFPQRPDITFVEPYPERLKSLLRSDDEGRVDILECKVQEVPPERFLSLGAGDLLFIDSSHVVKCGSDLHYLMFDVLPRLPAGIFVHFHDIFYPFDYPRDWLAKGTFWNESYFLRAFLSFNREWEIHFFNSYVALALGDVVERTMPLCMKNPGGSLYIRRT